MNPLSKLDPHDADTARQFGKELQVEVGQTINGVIAKFDNAKTVKSSEELDELLAVISKRPGLDTTTVITAEQTFSQLDVSIKLLTEDLQQLRDRLADTVADLQKQLDQTNQLHSQLVRHENAGQEYLNKLPASEFADEVCFRSQFNQRLESLSLADHFLLQEERQLQLIIALDQNLIQQVDQILNRTLPLWKKHLKIQLAAVRNREVNRTVNSLNSWAKRIFSRMKKSNSSTELSQLLSEIKTVKQLQDTAYAQQKRVAAELTDAAVERYQ